ncbi:MAG: hypothetical protein F6K08_33925, partial [Okeania sp. SIO1H6]|nr:hypothetical protein [Okeania sp. SIO1H6]
MKLNSPSIDFIFNYPAEEQDKIELLGKYISPMEDKVEGFRDKFEKNSWISDRDLVLVGEITKDNFKNLFIEQLFPIPDIKTFNQSNLKQYLQKNFPDTLDSLTFYLLEKERGIFHILEIANGLELSNSEASKLYMTCLTSHSPTYEQSLPLLESAIEKSVSFSEERVKFQTDDFMAVYQRFNFQDFQDKSPNKFTDKSPEKFSDKSPDPFELFLTSSE